MQLMIVFEEIIRVIFYAVPQLDFLPEWAACFPEDDVEIQAGVRTVRLSETQDYYQDATKDCLSEFTSVEFYAPDDDIDANTSAPEFGCIEDMSDAEQVATWLYRNRNKDDLHREIQKYAEEAEEYARWCLDSGIEADQDWMLSRFHKTIQLRTRFE